MGKLRLFPPIYVLSSEEPCYACGAVVPVMAIACEKYEEIDGPGASVTAL